MLFLFYVFQESQLDMPQRRAASQHRKGRASDCRMARRMLVLRCLHPAVPGAGGDYTGTSADEPDEICRRYPGARGKIGKAAEEDLKIGYLGLSVLHP